MYSPKIGDLLTNANTPDDVQIDFDDNNEPIITVFTTEISLNLERRPNKLFLQNLFKRKGF